MADAEPTSPYRQIVRDAAVDLLGAAAGAVGVAALVQQHRVLGLVLLAVMLAGVVLRMVWEHRDVERPPAALLSLGLVPRTLLLGALVIALAPPTATPSEKLAAGLGAGLLVAVVVSGPLLRRAATHRVRFVAHLPGVPADPPPRDLARRPSPPTWRPSWWAC